jgi:hypothetical protein
MVRSGLLIRKLGGRDLVGVAFADGGNVFRRAVDLELGQLRGALGIGVRYDSPIGPGPARLRVQDEPPGVYERPARAGLGISPEYRGGVLMRNSLSTAMVVAGLAAGVSAAGAQEIDRLLVRVNGAVLMQSDIRQARALKLVPDTGSDEATQRALENRLLMLGEVSRGAPAPWMTAN